MCSRWCFFRLLLVSLAVVADEGLQSLNRFVKRFRYPPSHLLARPTRTNQGPVPQRLQSLNLGPDRDGLIYVPLTYQPEPATPLVLMLHGAGGDAAAALQRLEGIADLYNVLLLAVTSQGSTWDVIRHEFGPDMTTIDRALHQTFKHYAVDPQRVAIAGFSDGASYALSVGKMNGHLFTHVIAFSPGFMVAVESQGNPRFFVSHGHEDPVLPIERCSRRIVPPLRGAGYDVVYHEFAGGHTVPIEISRQAMDWLTDEGARSPKLAS